MRPFSTPALVFALSLAAGAALAQQRQDGLMQHTPGMDHSNMPGMDHSKMQGSKMQGMDHSDMPGMDHPRMGTTGGQGTARGPAPGGQTRQPAQQGAQQRRAN